MITYNFDGGGGGSSGPCGWGWVRSDGATDCGALAPGTTSNIAEYNALTMAIHDAIIVCTNHREDSFAFRGDSLLVVNQVNGDWRVQSDRLRPLVNNCVMLLKGLPEWSLHWIPRKQNSRADEQAWKGKAMWTPMGRSNDLTGTEMYLDKMPAGWP